MRYDPMDTVLWMLDEARGQLADETVPGPTGRPRKKTKAQATAQQTRFETLCEVLWNVQGRPGELADYVEARMAG